MTDETTALIPAPKAEVTIVDGDPNARLSTRVVRKHKNLYTGSAGEHFVVANLLLLALGRKPASRKRRRAMFAMSLPLSGVVVSVFVFPRAHHESTRKYNEMDQQDNKPCPTCRTDEQVCKPLRARRIERQCVVEWHARNANVRQRTENRRE